MKQRLLLAILFLVTCIKAQVLVPTKCLEIESILVDACVPGGGCSNVSAPACNCEGKNEMVRFRVGSTAINITDLNVQWPNNSFRGIVQNATTDSLVAQLNSTIQSCGILIEPPSGLIPAGAQVLLITSTDMCATANSFASLTDTLYTIFQDAGNFQGHFANTNNNTAQTTVPTGASSLRTLIITQISTACSDTVSYDRSLLINTNGLYGGSTAVNDGSTVEFTWPGNPTATYVNRGCSAPYTPLTVTTPANATVCNTDTAVLIGVVNGNAVNVGWFGGNGTWTNTANDTAGYTPANNESGNINLYFFAVSVCGDTVTDTVQLVINMPPNMQLAMLGSDTLCPGDTVSLTASGAASYNWSTGATTASISITQPGLYMVSGSNTCGTDSAQVTITSAPAPNVAITASGPTSICFGDSIMLSVGGADSYLWNTGSTDDSIVVAPGSYTVTGTNYCGSQSVSIVINAIAPPQITIASSTLTICPGDSTQLIANGAMSYLWNTGDTASTIYAQTAGTYTIVGSNACGSDTASVFVAVDSVVIAQVAPSGVLTLCPGDSIILTASGGTNYFWSTNASGSSIAVYQPGNYYVIVGATCGTDTAYVTVGAGILPNVSVTPAGPVDLCVGDTISLQAAGATTYFWSNTDTTAALTVSAAGVYWVAGTNQCGTDTAFISVNTVQQPVVTIAGQDTICSGETVALTASGAGNYLWNTGNQGNVITVTTPGTYTVVGANVCGTDTAIIVVAPAVISAAVTASDTSGIAPFTVIFTALTNNAAAWQWSLGPNGFSSDSITTQLYTTVGEHEIILIATNAQGCSDTATLTIVVEPPNLVIEIPNVFSPNDDHLNDYFTPTIVGAESFELKIFDRWGVQLYSGDDSQIGWDGKFRNQPATTGTYWYILDIKLFTGERISKQGFLTLLR